MKIQENYIKKLTIIVIKLNELHTELVFELIDFF